METKTQKTIATRTKVSERNLTVKLSYNDTTKNFFIDFWQGEFYLISHKISEVHARMLSIHLDIKIMIA